MIYIFKKADKSLVYCGTALPSNLATDDYVEGFFEEGETFDPEYSYTLVDGKAVKGSKYTVDPALAEEAAKIKYQNDRKFKYPDIGDQLDALYWNRKGDATQLTRIEASIADTKTKWPKTLADMSQTEYDAKVKELYG